MPHSRNLCRVVAVLPVFVICVLTLGCSETQGDRKATAPVIGKVEVDGAVPNPAVRIECHPIQGMDQNKPSVSWCMTNPDGTFAISTYEQGDGVPEGEYALTFMWGQVNMISMSYGGPDRLGGKYDDISESPKTFTVKGDSEIDLGTISLTSKK